MARIVLRGQELYGKNSAKGALSLSLSLLSPLVTGPHGPNNQFLAVDLPILGSKIV